MAEYLAPGVYVEEFDSGIKAMEGVGTSTAGFVGMAQKGPVKGMPVLLTSMADYQRKFGTYLSEREYGDNRYLPYAVEQFFANGGSTCYVMRVCKEKEGTTATGTTKDSSFILVTAANPGAWGNSLQLLLKQVLKGKTKITQKLPKDAVAVAETALEALRAAEEAVKADMKALEEARKAVAAAQEVLDDEGASAEEKSAAEEAQAEAKKKITEVEAALPEKQATVEACEADFNEKAAQIYYEVEDTKNFQEGDTICVLSAAGESDLRYAYIKQIKGKEVYLSWPLHDKAGDSYLYLADWSLTASDENASEQYPDITFNENKSSYVMNAVVKSQLFTMKIDHKAWKSGDIEKNLIKGEDDCILIGLSGGKDVFESDASLFIGNDGAPGDRTGLAAFQTVSDVSIMAIPGNTDPAVQSALISHCENLASRFAILDMPLDSKEVSALQAFRENADTSYAAMYHPWLQCYDMLLKKNCYFPPSGAMAGIYGRTDNTRGVHKAPANETVRNCTGLSVNYNEAEQGKLNPKGINLIRSLPGQGIRVWGARTCSSDGNWKYVNVRRLFIYIEESIKANTNWAVFEPNDEILWSRVEGTIKVFLNTLWRNGALTGSSAEEAFFINIGHSTMTQDDILNGRLICVIGVAPVRPAEFVIFRITQKMETAQ